MERGERGAMCERLAAERKRLGLTQAELAQRIGTGRATLGMLETGRIGLDVGRLLELGTLGLDVMFILTGDRAKVAGGQLIDWELTIRLTKHMYAAAAEANADLPEQRAGAILKLLYLQAATGKVTEDKVMEDVMHAAL